MTKIKDLKFLNKKFNMLTIIEDDLTQKYNSKKTVKCKCDCGNIVFKQLKYIISNETKSCGCLKFTSKTITHGLTNTPEHKVWQGIKRRCYNPNDKTFKYYGAKGIIMSEDWKNNFTSFLRDMGKRPNNNYSIDRINPKGNYEKGNCRWVTQEIQARNKTTNKNLIFDNKTLCVAEWERQYNLPKDCIRKRLKRGWSVEKAITTPLFLFKNI